MQLAAMAPETYARFLAAEMDAAETVAACSTATHSASDRSCVRTTISGADGASYGSSIPVKPLISPARAFA